MTAAKYAPKKSQRYKAAKAARSRRQTARSPNHNPTGQSIDDFLASRGIYGHDNYRPKPMKVVRGGAPGLGKKA